MNDPGSSPPRASGKRVLAIGAIVGALFIAVMYAGVRYDQATSGPDEPDAQASSAPASTARHPHTPSAASR